MVFKFVILAAFVAAANAGVISTPVRYSPLVKTVAVEPVVQAVAVAPVVAKYAYSAPVDHVSQYSSSVVQKVSAPAVYATPVAQYAAPISYSHYSSAPVAHYAQYSAPAW